jgi:hypothetical protein
MLIPISIPLNKNIKYSAKLVWLLVKKTTETAKNITIIA